MQYIQNQGYDSKGRFEFILTKKEPQQALALSRALHQVPSYAIEYVTFYNNTTTLEPERIALYLGQLIINSDLIRPLLTDSDFRAVVNLVGPTSFRASDISNSIGTEIFAYPNTKIMELVAGQQLTIELVIKQGVGTTHAKWYPICTCVHLPHELGYKFSMYLRGNVSTEELLATAITIAQGPQDRRGTTIFTNFLVEPLQ